MCNEKAFTILDSDEQSKVYTTAEHSVKSIGTGEVIVNTKINKSKKNSVKLKDTLCVPDLRNNLLSVSKVTDNGYTVTFNKYRITIKGVVYIYLTFFSQFFFLVEFILMI